MKDPILGADFLKSHNLLVDVSAKQLVDSVTNLKVQGITSTKHSISLTTLSKETENDFDAIISQFPGVTQFHAGNQPIKHDITHHITTSGSPVFSRTRRLAPERLKIARAEFEHMLQFGIIRHSSSS